MVNLYATAAVLASGRPKPERALLNLTTPISSLRFNHDGQVLAFATRHTRDGLRLAHVASRTVFPNWPTPQTPLHMVTAVDFSPNSGYLGIGNARGRALLYRLNHVQDA